MGIAQDTVTSAARLALGQWMDRVGAAGMAAMRAVPGLLAVVDQHAAQVRDAVADRHGRLHPVTLAAYADGVADAAAAKGRAVDGWPAGDWNTAPWASVRLLAVCVLAEATA